MDISKKDALAWFEFFAALDPESGDMLSTRQMEIAWAVIAQIERAEDARTQALIDAIPGLKTLNGRTYYVGPDAHFPRGCRSCLLGTGLSAVRRTNRCNLCCPFCYDYGVMDCQPAIGEDYWEIGGTGYHEDDIELLLSIHKAPTGICYVYLEPFMEIEKYYSIIARFHAAGIHQHMYTNGTLATEENLRALGEAGLDELRFNLGASNAADSVIEAMGIAKQYIPQVGIETPMTPQFHAAFIEKRAAIFAAGIDYMNCAELHLTPNNLINYLGEPLYMYRHGYVSPIWSRELTLSLMRRASEERWPIAVHDCSNRTKFARDMNLRAKEGGWFGSSSYGSEFDAIPFETFLPILRMNDFRFLKESPLPQGYGIGDGLI